MSHRTHRTADAPLYYDAPDYLNVFVAADLSPLTRYGRQTDIIGLCSVVELLIECMSLCSRIKRSLQLLWTSAQRSLSQSHLWLWLERSPCCVLRMLCLPAGLRVAQPCRYCFCSLAQKWVFRPTGATRRPDERESWHGGAVRFPVPTFTFIGATCRPCGAKNPFLGQ